MRRLFSSRDLLASRIEFLTWLGKLSGPESCVETAITINVIRLVTILSRCCCFLFFLGGAKFSIASILFAS